jgi:hypothetical protein
VVPNRLASLLLAYPVVETTEGQMADSSVPRCFI